MSLSRVGASQNSESAGKEKKKKTERKKTGRGVLEEEGVNREGRGREASLSSRGGRKKSSRIQALSTVKYFYVCSVPQRQSLVCLLTNAQWVTDSFPEVERRYSDWSPSLKSSDFSRNGLPFCEVRVVNLGTNL